MTQIGSLGTLCDGVILRARLQSALNVLFADPETIDDLFTHDYRQTVDGIVSDRDAYKAYLYATRETFPSVTFTVLEAVWQGDTLAERHLMRKSRADGSQIQVEGYLFGSVQGGRFWRVDEINRLISDNGRPMSKA